MRNRKKPWAQGELENNNLIIKNAEEFKGKWHLYFNNSNPIHLEIGCGKGSFITKLSQKNPNINYIALERASQVIVTGARKLRELSEENNFSGNLVFVLGNVTNLKDYFKEEELDRLYINFCDPWPRKKWAKRRLTYREFLNTYKLLLKQNSEIHFKTDNKQLFEFSLNEFCNQNWHLKNISLDLHNSNFEENIMTEYEKKFSDMGMPIYRLEAWY